VGGGRLPRADSRQMGGGACKQEEKLVEMEEKLMAAERVVDLAKVRVRAPT
jgi:hypothetical protein